MSEMGLAHYNDYLKGSEDALEQLVRTYSDALIRYAYCYVQDATAAEDIMEDTIVALIMKRKRLHDGTACVHICTALPETNPSTICAGRRIMYLYRMWRTS